MHLHNSPLKWVFPYMIFNGFVQRQMNKHLMVMSV